MTVGKKPGYRQVTMYVDPELYERVRQLAYHLREDIFEFVGKALDSAVEQRSTPKLRAAIDMVTAPAKNGQRRTRSR